MPLPERGQLLYPLLSMTEILPASQSKVQPIHNSKFILGTYNRKIFSTKPSGEIQTLLTTLGVPPTFQDQRW